jgi:hypothetical protein
LNGVQEVAGSNPAGPISLREWNGAAANSTVPRDSALAMATPKLRLPGERAR